MAQALRSAGQHRKRTFSPVRRSAEAKEPRSGNSLRAAVALTARPGYAGLGSSSEQDSLLQSWLAQTGHQEDEWAHKILGRKRYRKGSGQSGDSAHDSGKHGKIGG